MHLLSAHALNIFPEMGPQSENVWGSTVRVNETVCALSVETCNRDLYESLPLRKANQKKPERGTMTTATFVVAT